jgi:hypothetical protein
MADSVLGFAAFPDFPLVNSAVAQERLSEAARQDTIVA